MDEQQRIATHELLRALGLSGIDPPQWRRGKDLTRREKSLLRSLRYARNIGRLAGDEYSRQKEVLEAQSKARYEVANPRRPERWGNTVQRYMKLRHVIIERGGLTKQGAQEIVKYVSREAVAERCRRRNELKRVRREARERGQPHRRDWAPGQGHMPEPEAFDPFA